MCFGFGPVRLLYHRLFRQQKRQYLDINCNIIMPASNVISTPLISPKKPRRTLRYMDLGVTELFSGDYNLKQGRKIGSGYSSTVNKCVYSPINNKEDVIMAVKVMLKEKPKLLTLALSEIALLRRCQSQNVVRFESAFECRDAFVIFTEFCSRGDVFSNIKYLSDVNLLRHYMQGIVQGLKAIHEKRVAHCDIKMKNILISDNNVIKIADFGFAVYLENDRNTISVRNGTQDYWAPEMYKEPVRFNPFLADIYALGVTFVGMCEQRAIKRKNDNIIHIVTGYKDVHKRQMLLGMLEADPKERWSLKAVLNGDWISDISPPPSPT